MNGQTSNPLTTFAPFGTAFLDARTLIQDDYPDVFEQLRILMKSPGIPHPPVVFGPDFPANVRRQIEKTLVTIAESPDSTWEDSIGALTAATGLDKAKKKEFSFLRSVLEAVATTGG